MIGTRKVQLQWPRLFYRGLVEIFGDSCSWANDSSERGLLVAHWLKAWGKFDMLVLIMNECQYTNSEVQAVCLYCLSVDTEATWSRFWCQSCMILSVFFSIFYAFPKRFDWIYLIMSTHLAVISTLGSGMLIPLQGFQYNKAVAQVSSVKRCLWMYLQDEIQPPFVVSQLNLVEQVWPEESPNTESLRPEVHRCSTEF